MSIDPNKKVVVIGSGSWGTAVANVFADAGNSVVIWGRNQEIVSSINNKHENPQYLPGIPLSKNLKASNDLVATLKSATLIVNGIPTQQIRNVFKPHSELLANKLILNTSKGIEIKTHLRVSQIFEELSPTSSYAILSGPSFSKETAKRLPTLVTVACTNLDKALSIQKALKTPYFRAYTSQDTLGVELAGALKNVIAIASGIVNGLELGYNTQAALINRGIAEIIRMGKKQGAGVMTFLGLSGVGDLILTCTGPLSRNRTLGTLLGQGKKLEEALKELGGVAEGYYTAESAYELSKIVGVEMPITEQIYKILYHGSTAQKALTELMQRDLKEEW